MRRRSCFCGQPVEWTIINGDATQVSDEFRRGGPIECPKEQVCRRPWFRHRGIRVG